MSLSRIERRVLETKYWSKMREKEIKYLSQGINIEEKKVLNIGSGTSDLKTGNFLKATIVNVDIEELPGVDIVASATKLPFEEASFDIVIFLRVLHHIEDFTQALQEALRCVKAGGYILLSEPYGLVAKLTDVVGITSHPKRVIRQKDIDIFVGDNGLIVINKINRIFWYYYGYQIKV